MDKTKPYGDAVGIIDLITAGDERGKEQLYHALKRYTYPFFLQQLRDVVAAEDELQEIWMIAYRGIKSGTIREPEKLFGWVKVVAKRRIANAINVRTSRRKNEAALDIAVSIAPAQEGTFGSHGAMTKRLEKDDLVAVSMIGLRENEKEILCRFYLLEESPEAIQSEMGLDKTQFRLLKSRAKTKFGNLGREVLKNRRGRLKILTDQHATEREMETGFEEKSAA